MNILNSEQTEILNGSMLGDGSMVKIYGNGNSAFMEGHGKSQYDYLKWKFEKLKPFSMSMELSNRKFIVGFDKSKNKIIMSDHKKKCCWIMRTIKHPVFKEWEKKWYLRDYSGEYILENGVRIKTVPLDLELSPLSLAVWFMDDGSNSYNGKRHARNAVFHTLSFTKNECEFLCGKMRKMGLENCKVRKHCCVRDTKPRYEIIVCAKSFRNFLEIIDKHIPIESMRYKADLKNFKEANKKPSAKIDKNIIKNILKLSSEGCSYSDISKIVGISKTTISNLFRGVSWGDCTGIRVIKNRLANNNKSGIKGVFFHKLSKKWMARITVNGDKKYLGIYSSKEEAEKARKKAEIKFLSN